MVESRSSHQPGPWSRGETLTLLSQLNLNIQETRQHVQEDMKEGVPFASELLSSIIGGGISASRVARKISSLWKNYKSSPMVSLEDVYCLGACNRTLSRLDELYPGILEEIASFVQSVQNLTGTSEVTEKNTLTLSQHPIHTDRRTRSRSFQDPIKCRCGFTHDASSTLHCDGCPSWQHTFCYYRTDSTREYENREHLCDECQMRRTKTVHDTLPAGGIVQRGKVSSPLLEESVLDRFTLLSTGESDAPVIPPKQNDASQPESLNKLLTYNMNEDEVNKNLRAMVGRIRYVANRVSTLDIPTDFSSEATKSKVEELKKLYKSSFGINIQNAFQDISGKSNLMSISSSDMTKAIIAAANYQWIFLEDQTILSSYKLVLEAYQRVIYVKEGMDMLKDVHRAAWSIIMDNFDHRNGLRNVWKIEAETLRRRLLPLLEISSSNSEGKETGQSFPNNRQSGKEKQWLDGHLDPIFSTLLQLKVDLQLSEHYYDIIFPASGELFDPAFMQTEGGLSRFDEIPEGSVVLLSLAPAIIQHTEDSNNLQEQDNWKGILSRISVKMTKAQRVKGKVLGRAIVQIG